MPCVSLHMSLHGQQQSCRANCIEIRHLSILAQQQCASCNVLLFYLSSYVTPSRSCQQSLLIATDVLSSEVLPLDRMQ
eukprot:2655445-Pleurochrysis_carterae.AAC.1